MRYLKILAAALMTCSVFSANATLIGDTVTFNTFFPSENTLRSTQDLLVSDAVECNACDISGGFVLAGQTLDIGADYITFVSDAIIGFSGPAAIFDFVGLDWVGGASALIGFSLTTDFANVMASDVSFTTDSIRIDIGNSGSGSFWRLDLITNAVGPVAIPEPGVLALFCMGLLGVSLARRK